MKENKVWMATGNHHKYNEAKVIMAELGIELERIEVERVEIQANDLSDIAAHSVKLIQDDGRPIAVEDAGIFIDHYRGFPGPYSPYVIHTINLSGILKLMEGIEHREASFKSAIAFRHRGEIRFFRGYVKGKIALSIRGIRGFSYDPIFIPDEGDGRTFGEMTSEEKNALSHRARAFRALGEWLRAWVWD